MAIGIFGGTFDPVHNAHLAIARRALEALALERLRWLPTGRPVHRAVPLTPATHRVAMLELALAGDPRYEIDCHELAPEATGYTWDTLRALRGELGETRPVVFLIGNDQAAKFDQWHRWREVLDLVHLGVFARAGEAAALPTAVRAEFDARQVSADGGWRARAGGAVIPVEWTPLAVSATELRARLARGDTAAGRVPAAVLDYISHHRLYQEQA
jgi:nicotinate-nucleotide adenylyltransferase